MKIPSPKRLNLKRFTQGLVAELRVQGETLIDMKHEAHYAAIHRVALEIAADPNLQQIFPVPLVASAFTQAYRDFDRALAYLETEWASYSHPDGMELEVSAEQAERLLNSEYSPDERSGFSRLALRYRGF